MFMGKELHYPTPMLYCPPPTYNSHPCYLKLRGGTKRNETNELTDRTHPRFVSFIVLDGSDSRCFQLGESPRRVLLCDCKTV